jgi:UDP-glucuronate 4-epimerase
LTVLVTGAAGFIGFHVSRLLLDRDHVVGVDNLNSYYDVRLKRARLAALHRPGFEFVELDLNDASGVDALFRAHKPQTVIHLAAQPGVRHSVSHPIECLQNNVMGFLNVLEACRNYGVASLVYASSSSVYGANSRLPFSPQDGVAHPMSLYAASKRSNELMAHSYSHLYGIPSTGLRFFTVYGPWGRPDMSYFRFAEAISNGEPLEIYGDGSFVRDFTFVDDIAEIVARVAALPASPDEGWTSTDPNPATSSAPFRIYNIGYGSQTTVSGLVDLLEEELGRKAHRVHLPEQPGDVPATRAEVEDLLESVDFVPQTGVKEGLASFVAWFREWKSR